MKDLESHAFSSWKVYSVYLHFRSTNAPDYFARRDMPCPRTLKMSRYGATYRLAHINMCLDMRSIVRAAGPSPDGTGAEIFYDVTDTNALEEILRDDPYVLSGVWSSWRTRQLVDFIEPPSQVLPCLDGTRRVTAVEVAMKDCPTATATLRRLQEEEILAVGGVTADAVAIAWICDSDQDEALRRFNRSALEVSGAPAAHPMIWVL